MHRLWKAAEAEQVSIVDGILKNCENPSYFDVNLLISVLCSSLVDDRAGHKERQAISRFIPRPRACYFHSLVYDPEGTCYVCDLVDDCICCEKSKQEVVSSLI